ncbi:MAG: hypothetical protein MJZ62_07300 [Bacteroidales bacterium]|nr:hypothetical protein [Bacteroidales bacterium]
MNRNIEVERAISERPFSQIESDAFRLGVLWADTHPIYPEGIPIAGDKTPGEVLVLITTLKRYAGDRYLINRIYNKIKENVDNGRQPFEGIG